MTEYIDGLGDDERAQQETLFRDLAEKIKYFEGFFYADGNQVVMVTDIIGWKRPICCLTTEVAGYVRGDEHGSAVLMKLQGDHIAKLIAKALNDALRREKK